MSGAAPIALLLACAALTLSTVVGWLLVAALSPVVRQQRRRPAPIRAALIAQTRLLPLACVTILVPAQISAFARYEADIAESAGTLLMLAAGLGIALTLDALWHAGRGWRDTARALRAWKVSAAPLTVARWRRRAWSIHPPFPVAAVVGIFRPELFVSTRVIETCTADELAAIAAHEAAHVAARDNVVRWLFRLTPGARLCRRLAAPLEKEWVAAAEQRADAWAVRSGAALDLASALTKVARLVAGDERPAVVASTLIGSSDLAERVHRLLEPPAAHRRHPAVWLPVGAIAAIAVILQLSPAAASVHELFEWLVRHN